MLLRCLTVAVIVLCSSVPSQAYWSGLLHCDRVTIFNCEVKEKRAEIEKLKDMTLRTQASVNDLIEGEKKRRGQLDNLEKKLKKQREIYNNIAVPSTTDWQQIEILKDEYLEKQKGKIEAQVVVNAIVASGLNVKETVDAFNKMQMTPIIHELDSRIRDLNLEAAGLSLGNHQNLTFYKNLIQDLFVIRSKLHNKRITLKTLARETISRADRLLRFITKSEENKENNEKSTQYLKHAAKGMADLIKRSEKKLADAENDLTEVLDKLSVIDSNLHILKRAIAKKQEKIDEEIQILKVTCLN